MQAIIAHHTLVGQANPEQKSNTDYGIENLGPKYVFPWTLHLPTDKGDDVAVGGYPANRQHHTQCGLPVPALRYPSHLLRHSADGSIPVHRVELIGIAVPDCHKRLVRSRQYYYTGYCRPEQRPGHEYLLDLEKGFHPHHYN
ncbi:hypothetical protein ES705_29320 [subsurface metagenome]